MDGPRTPRDEQIASERSRHSPRAVTEVPHCLFAGQHGKRSVLAKTFSSLVGREMRILLAFALLTGLGCQSVGRPSLAMLDFAGKRKDAKVVEHMKKSSFPTPQEVGLKDLDTKR